MKLNDFYNIANKFAPTALSEEYCAKYGAYDNSGILVDTGEEVKGALFSLDLSFAAINRAIEYGVNVILTHHPAIYAKIANVCEGDFQPLGKKLITAIRHGISVVSMHLNLDCAEGGIDESLAQGICLSTGADAKLKGNTAIMHALSCGGYGRAYDVKQTTLTSLLNRMQTTFATKRIQAYGDSEKQVTRIASFCGAGADEDAVRFAVQAGAQVIVSSDFKHHVITLALESGLCVVSLTHYASEEYGFKKYYEKMRQSAGVPCYHHTDENLL